MSRSAPWWLTWALLGGLVALFLGERVLEVIGPARAVFSGLGALAVLGCLAWRTSSWRAAEGGARRVEALLLAAYAGCVLALVLYLVSSEDGMRWLGIDFRHETEARYRTVMHVLWTITLAVSLLPALGAQIALGAHRHARAAGAGLEALRVRGTATAALTVALAGAFLFVIGWIAAERDATLDLSYFRTSSPGSGTIAMVEGLRDPLHVLLFFPDVNPVKDEVLGYFRALERAGGRIEIETHDRLVAPQLAEEHRVRRDGTILLASGGQEQRIVLGDEMSVARSRLRTLDRDVQRQLMMLLRRRRVAYLTTGHGELNDSVSAGPLMAAGLGGVDAFQDLLRILNYDVRPLGLADGLGVDVPDNAAMVVVLGPRRPFLPEELETLDRYLARGGSLLLALDPESDFDPGPLVERLGVRYVAEPLADDQQFVRRRGNLSDRRLIIAPRFSSHAAVTTLSRARRGGAVLFVGAGHLEPAADAGATAGGVTAAASEPAAPGAPRPDFVVRSLPSTFADRNGNFQFDEGTEQRRSYNLVAAVEVEAPPATLAKAAPGAAGAEAGDNGAAADTEDGGAADRGAAATDDDARSARPMRALVYADAEMFTDAVLRSLGLNAALVADGVKWLGGEEALAGVAESEEDVPIQHTKAEDVIWFYSTILGAPALVLAFGLIGVWRRRRRGGVAA
ncbi:MAG TPA: Gldg family protein [Longimicrobiales bacterium]